MIKPVVHFTGEVDIRQGNPVWNNGKPYRFAIIRQVQDHPVLGDQDWVRTSILVKVNRAKTRIETLNTIYEKV
jgi:hypothetical protein